MYNIVRIPKKFHAMTVESTNKNKINIGRKQGEKDRPTSEVSPCRYIRQINRKVFRQVQRSEIRDIIHN